MPIRARVTLILLAALFISACTLPGAASPTPFTFPTPNLTLTFVFAPTATNTVSAPTLPPVATPTIDLTSEPPPATATTVSGSNTRPNGSPITAAFTSTAPVIDGDLAEWTGDAFNVNQIVFGAASWSGGSDVSGTLFVTWDNDNLYLAVRVTDDSFVQISTGSQLYKGDSVEFQLDANLSADFLSQSLTADDYQIGLSPGNFGSRVPEAYRWYPTSRTGALSSATVAAKQTSGGYDLEASIPWSVFGVTPSTGARYGFAFSISDNDLSATAVQQSMVSTVSTRRLLDPTTWGTLILGEP